MKEITVANDGIVNQAPVLSLRAAQLRHDPASWTGSGVSSRRTRTASTRSARSTTSAPTCCRCPKGDTVKKALYRQLRRVQRRDHQPLHGDPPADRRATAASPARSPSTRRTAEFLVVRAKAVILCAGAAGRLGLPASGYLFGTYENAANAGDGYAMAYHAGAELANLECFQINPLIKDYNGPACAYVTRPVRRLHRQQPRRALHRVRLLVGPDDARVLARAAVRQGPGVPQARPPARETIARDRDDPAHGTSGRAAGASTSGAAPTTARDMVEMHISEIGFCSGHSASGVLVDEHARTTVPGLYAAGDMASVPHNYMLGAFTNGAVAGEDAAASAAEVDHAEYDPADVEAERERVLAPTRRERRRPAQPGRVQGAAAGQRLPAAAQGHPQHGDLPAPLRRGAGGSRDRDGGARRRTS